MFESVRITPVTRGGKWVAMNLYHHKHYHDRRGVIRVQTTNFRTGKSVDRSFLDFSHQIVSLMENDVPYWIMGLGDDFERT